MAKNQAPEETAPAEAAKNITVYATAHLSEDGVNYAPGDKLEVSEARAAALGKLVSLTAPSAE